MRSIIYVYIIIQFLNFLGVFAEKVKGDSSESNSVNWEKLDKTRSIPLKKIIWKSYNNDKFYFENKNLGNDSERNKNV